jgi:hypothetical protein
LGEKSCWQHLVNALSEQDNTKVFLVLNGSFGVMPMATKSKTSLLTLFKKQKREKGLLLIKEIDSKILKLLHLS